jgi:transcriptional regulator with XRE-family HTH domain
MLFKDFTKLNGLKYRFVAKELGISECYIGLILSRKRMPSRQLAIDIENFSGGKVSREEAMFPENY